MTSHFKKLFYFLGMVYITMYLLADMNKYVDIGLMENQMNYILKLAPTMMIVGVIIVLCYNLFIAWEDIYTDDLNFNFNRLKFWEWRLRYYIPFYFIMIILTHIINRGLGFIISIVLSIVTIYKMIKNWIRVKKGEG